MAGRRGWMGAWARRMLWAAAIAAPAGSVFGQTQDNLSLTRTYGAGVHAYFSGDFDRSYDELTAAVEAGSEDPRTRYFRGLAALRLGRQKRQLVERRHLECECHRAALADPADQSG